MRRMNGVIYAPLVLVNGTLYLLTEGRLVAVGAGK